MPKTTTGKVTDLVTAVRRLPEESQAPLVDEVDRRLANPRYADPGRVRDFFARYGVRSE